MNYLWIIPAALYSTLIVFLSSLPSSAFPELGFRVSDKLLHGLEYFIFAVLWYIALRPFAIGRRPRFLAGFVFFGAALFAATDEIHQSFVPGRHADVVDWIADAAGAFAGTVASSAFFVRARGKTSGRPRNPTLPVRHIMDSLFLCLSDSIVLVLGLLLGEFILFLMYGLPVSPRYSLALIPVWCIGAVLTRTVPAWGLGPVEELRRIQILLLSVFALAGISTFMAPVRVDPSRIVFVASYAFSAVAIPLARLAVKKILIRAGLWGCPVAVYGNLRNIADVIDALQSDPLLGYKPAAVFTDDPVPAAAGVPVLGGLTGATDRAVVAVAPIAMVESRAMAATFDRTFAGYRRVILLPDIREDVFLSVIPRNFGSLVGLEISSNLSNPFARFFKRLTELALVLASAPLWLPLVVLIALAILTAERQNPFFLQRRVGRGGRTFAAVKFRTMVRDAEEVLQHALAGDEALRREWNERFKLRNDPRITRIGKFLRRTSLDELPQLFNVFAGTMSLVGPRPLPAYHHEQLAASARTPRNRVRPGITGLWQVSGRSETGNAGMEKWDTYYVRNWSVWLDLVILARTVSAVLKGEGAY